MKIATRLHQTQRATHVFVVEEDSGLHSSYVREGLLQLHTCSTLTLAGPQPWQTKEEEESGKWKAGTQKYGEIFLSSIILVKTALSKYLGNMMKYTEVLEMKKKLKFFLFSVKLVTQSSPWDNLFFLSTMRRNPELPAQVW